MERQRKYIPATSGDSTGNQALSKACSLIHTLILALDKRSPFDEVLEEVLASLGFDSIGMYLFNEDCTKVVQEYFKTTLENLHKRFNPLDLLHVVREGSKSMIIRSDDYHGLPENEQQEVCRELIVVPIAFNESVQGLITATGMPHEYSADCARILETFAMQLGWSLHTLRMNEYLRDVNAKLVLAKNELEHLVDREISELHLTEKRVEEIQAQLIQSERLSTMGKLITGVAHEIKNPLTAIKGYVDLISGVFSRVDTTNRYSDIVQGLEVSVSHLETIVTNYLSFSRNSDNPFQLVSPAEVIEKTALIVRHFLTIKKIRLSIRVEEDLPYIVGDMNQLVQVLMNLIINAEQAIVDDNGTIDINVYEKDRRICIEVRDNGIGISEADLPRIFESFFTTKGLDKSSGIGLAVSKQIIENHRGTVSVVSKEMLGTRFCITLPVYS